MRVRTFLLITTVLVLTYVFAALVIDNSEVLNREFALVGGASVQMKWVLFLAFVAGVIVSVVSVGLREWGLWIERWRLRRDSRKSEEIEEELSHGLVAVLEHRDEEALRHFRAVLERNSRHFNTLIHIGDVLRGQGKFSEAIEYHRKANHLKPANTRALYALVEDHEAQGDLDRARHVLGKIIAVNKTSAAAWRKLRSLHQKDGHWDRALEAHEKVERLDRDGRNEVDRRCGLGIRYEIAAGRLSEGKYREAIAGFRRVLKDDDGFIPSHVGLGRAFRSASQDAEAVRAWQSGFEITGSPIFLTLLEDHYLEREQPLAAIEALKRCIAGARKDTLPRFHLGKLYFRLEMLDDAQSVLSSLEGRASYAPTLHYLLGRIHERRENPAKAASEYRKVIREMDLIQLDYQCRACGGRLMEWDDRCGSCGEWNTIEVNFREEMPLEDLGIAPAPIYTTGN